MPARNDRQRFFNSARRDMCADANFTSVLVLVTAALTWLAAWLVR